MFDVIIIGAGPAGISCALRCRELGLKPLVLEQGVVANTIADYHNGKKMFGVVGFFQASAGELIDFYRRDLRRARVDVREGQKAVSVKKDGNFFRVATKTDVFKSRAVVVAVGIQGIPQTLGVTGESGKHVHYKIGEPKEYAGRSVMVVGGGDAAVEAAVALADAGAKTVLSYRRHEFFRVKEMNLKKIRGSSVDVRFSTNIVKIAKKKVILRHASDLLEELRVDDVFVFVGTFANDDFLREIGLEFDSEGNVVYNESTLETTVKGLFVAGDITKEKQKLIMPAMYQGFVAASSVLGYKTKNR